MINESAYHRAYGKHSNIPDCCIEFWLTEWLREFRDELGTGWSSPYARAINRAGWGYVPCPECFGGGFKIKVRDCAKECKRDCRKDFEIDLDKGEFIC